MLPLSSNFFIRSVEIDWMRAFVCVLSVRMPICAPVRLTASAPRVWIAIAIRAMGNDARKLHDEGYVVEADRVLDELSDLLKRWDRDVA